MARPRLIARPGESRLFQEASQAFLASVMHSISAAVPNPVATIHISDQPPRAQVRLSNAELVAPG
jgi:hypothetical protein